MTLLGSSAGAFDWRVLDNLAHRVAKLLHLKDAPFLSLPKTLLSSDRPIKIRSLKYACEYIFIYIYSYFHFCNLVNFCSRLDRGLGRIISFARFSWISQGREGYLELGDDPVMLSEETDDDGYLKPREIVPPGYKATLLNGNVTSGSNKDLQGSNRSLTNESKSKDLIHERYTELGFKPSNNANDLETAL